MTGNWTRRTGDFKVKINMIGKGNSSTGKGKDRLG